MFSSSIKILLIATQYLIISTILEKGFALKGRQISEYDHSHTVTLNSLLPKTSCAPFNTPGPRNGFYLKLMHKRGPCSPLDVQDRRDPRTHTRILENDNARVRSIYQYMPFLRAGHSLNGTAIGEGNYVVNVGLGIPRQEVSLILDTSTSLSWTRCNQSDKTFHPAKSTSYDTIQCHSLYCSRLRNLPGILWSDNCYGSTLCEYGIDYPDHLQLSLGRLIIDRISLTSDGKSENLIFGCTTAKFDGLGGASGLLGLNQGKLSVLSKTATVFSYCFPSTSSYTGYLNFVDHRMNFRVNTTRLLLTNWMGGSSYYTLKMIGISVGGVKLPIKESMFSITGTIIDSGTEITRLPSKVYSIMSKEFRKRMINYPRGKELYGFDTCYNLMGYESVTIPTMSFHFEGEVEMKIHPSGILYVASKSQVCLAFTKNEYENKVGIIGNMQQKTNEVMYDIGRMMVRFRLGACN